MEAAEAAEEKLREAGPTDVLRQSQPAAGGEAGKLVGPFMKTGPAPRLRTGRTRGARPPLAGQGGSDLRARIEGAALEEPRAAAMVGSALRTKLTQKWWPSVGN